LRQRRRVRLHRNLIHGLIVLFELLSRTGWRHFPACTGLIRARLAQHCRVVILHEHYTSKRCSKCAFKPAPAPGQSDNRMNDLKDGTSRKGRRKRKIYGVRYCENISCKTTWHRDTNAARNMRLVFLHMLRNGQVRPEGFQHQGALSAAAAPSAAAPSAAAAPP